jgi:hypothetical protein
MALPAGTFTVGAGVMSLNVMDGTLDDVTQVDSTTD